MTRFSSWVRCLNCEQVWFLEKYSSKTQCYCPVCNSREYEIDDGLISDHNTKYEDDEDDFYS